MNNMINKYFTEKVIILILTVSFGLSYILSYNISYYAVLTFFTFDEFVTKILINYAVLIIVVIIIICIYRYFYLVLFGENIENQIFLNANLNNKRSSRKKSQGNENKLSPEIIGITEILILFSLVMLGVTTGVKESIMIKDFFVFVFAIYIIIRVLYEKINIKFNYFFIIFGIYVIYILCLSFFSGYPHYSFRLALNYLSLIIIGAYIYSVIKTEHQIKQLINYIFFFGIITSVICFIQYSEIEIFDNKADSFTFGNKNFFLDYLFLLMGITLYKIEINYKKRILLILHSIYFLCLLGLIFLLNSYSGFISLSIFITVFLIRIFVISKSYRPVFIFFAFIILISVIIFFLVPRSKINIIKYDFFNSSSVQIRKNLWISSIKMFKNNYISGIGPGTFSVYFPEYSTEEYKKKWRNSSDVVLHSHGELFETAAETGLIGLILFVLPFIIFFLKTIKMKFWNSSVSTWIYVTLIIIVLHSLYEVTSRKISTQIIITILLSLVFVKQNEMCIKIIESKKHNNYPDLLKKILMIFLIIIIIDNTKLLRAQFMNEKMNISDISFSEKLFNKDPDVYYRKGYLEYQSNNFENSIKSYKQCINLNKNFVEVKFNLAFAYYSAGKFEESKKVIDEAVILYPNNTNVNNLKKMIYEKTTGK